MTPGKWFMRDTEQLDLDADQALWLARIDDGLDRAVKLRARCRSLPHWRVLARWLAVRRSKRQHDACWAMMDEYDRRWPWRDGAQGLEPDREWQELSLPPMVQGLLLARRGEGKA